MVPSLYLRVSVGVSLSIFKSANVSCLVAAVSTKRRMKKTQPYPSSAQSFPFPNLDLFRSRCSRRMPKTNEKRITACQPCRDIQKKVSAILHSLISYFRPDATVSLLALCALLERLTIQCVRPMENGQCQTCIKRRKECKMPDKKERKNAQLVSQTGVQDGTKQASSSVATVSCL